MREINQYLLDARRKCGEKSFLTEQEQDMAFSTLVTLFSQAAEEWLADKRNNANPVYAEMLDLYFAARMFRMISELYDEHYITIREISGSEVSVTLFCLDPSGAVASGLAKARASILFSATLTPLPYYREILGGAESDQTLSLNSPFEQTRLLLAAHKGISTRYADRNRSYPPIAEIIYLATEKKKGNYLIFFPSYEYMRQVYKVFSETYPEIHTLIQDHAMSEDARAGFLAEFDGQNAETLLGFCVLGGIFSEGIDLKGDRLIGVVVVGVGLPKISLRQNLIREYYDRINGQGYDYAYVFPGMNKVLQAVGRVIRTEADAGIAVLIDSRFGTGQYIRLYPSHWSHIKYIRSPGELNNAIRSFEYFNRPPGDG